MVKEKEKEEEEVVREETQKRKGLNGIPPPQNSYKGHLFQTWTNHEVSYLKHRGKEKRIKDDTSYANDH